MSASIIKVNKLGKRYTIRHEKGRGPGYRRLSEDLGNLLARPFRHRANAEAVRSTEDIWALRDVSFDVAEGEVVAIIGRNGAGKSTVLKILSRITEPTEGRAQLSGRVASLLEVGTGFHPELTGRENVYLNGSILGMSRSEIRRKFDDIVDFAEIAQFIDTPVKRFSSGMSVRLAFSVAAHLDPEILIVDEVLAVGDASFQKRSLSKMGSIARDGGRTVLFVSHNMVAVQSFCSRCIVLSKGRVTFDGPVAAGIGEYLSGIETLENEHHWNDESTAPGTAEVKLRCIAIRQPGADPGRSIGMSAPVEVATEYVVRKDNTRVHLTYHVYTDMGALAFSMGSDSQPHDTGTYKTTFTIPAHLLNSGAHYLRLLVVYDGSHVVYERDALASFAIVDDRNRSSGWMGREPGVVAPLIACRTVKLESR